MNEYFILNMVDGKPGVLRERNTFDEAVDIAVEMAAEQCDTDKAMIRQDLENAMEFYPNEGGWSIHLLQVTEG